MNSTYGSGRISLVHFFDESPLVEFLSSSQDARMRAPCRAILMSIAAILAAGWIGKVGSAFADGTRRPPHPEPRVIVNVLSVNGPHKPDRVQHDVRFGWKRIVRCYKAQSAKEKAVVMLELVVSGAGSVTRGRRLVFEEKDGELAACLAETLTGLSMPKAPADSRADIEIRLSPGDAPEKS